jgi:IS30 family transposase
MGAAMGNIYSQLSLSERIEIYRLHTSSTSDRSIAKELGRSPSTISRELRRNAKPSKYFPVGYSPERANVRALRRRRWDKRFKMLRQPALREYVRNRLAMGWSPQQIAGRLARDKAPMRISYESIYRFIYYRSAQKDYWHRLLPQRKHRRGRLKRGGTGSVNYIKRRLTLEHRSKAANDRLEPGHWEADLMMFAKYGQGILVMHERLTRVIRMLNLANKSAPQINAKIVQILRPVPLHMRRSITFDNGPEFAHHYKIADMLDLQTFFCDARAPWQKGGVENAIGRMRRPLPRKSDLATVTYQKLQSLVRRYNNTPRLCLDYKTPHEIFNSVALQT